MRSINTAKVYSINDTLIYIELCICLFRTCIILKETNNYIWFVATFNHRKSSVKMNIHFWIIIICIKIRERELYGCEQIFRTSPTVSIFLFVYLFIGMPKCEWKKIRHLFSFVVSTPTLIEIYYTLIDFANFQLMWIGNDANSDNCWIVISKLRQILMK